MMFVVKIKCILLVIALLTFGFWVQDSLAQTDSTKAGIGVQKSSFVSIKQEKSDESAGHGSDMVLDEILIEAIIDKPNVAILPNRELTDLGDIEFINRSFEKELRAVPKDVFIIDHQSELRRSVDRLKTILKQKKK